ncbi:transglycosylase SLT domain-containing protein [uncultured Sunxiuqinia sp.]|uniref:lytic transglycosylase domain-containing protein n=1 Tax=uncultured Sunxiuqinia sp. TaxID=1573825 RepID=UPI002AA661C1|nr:transglycosylase SLT domain-containing protein [uncultured Sunxiuqinia sp.]
MRKGLGILVVLVSFTIQNVFAKRIEKAAIKRIRTIEVVALDSVQGYQKKYVTPDENLNDIFAEKIDSLVNSWYMRNVFDRPERIENQDSIPIVSLPDSIYIERLQAIDSYVDLSFNKTVKNFIELYTQRRRDQVEMMLGLAGYYFPIFEEELDRLDMPLELKYMAIIESALNPAARSRANAVGLWQFMYGTGKMYKLEIGTFVDERRDPVKSTKAAARYLNDLYRIYKNWHLVIAAYNCGPGNVNKAIRRSGGARDYWSIYYRLPRETRGYVPAFIAAAYVMTNYEKHNLQPRYPDFPIVADTMMVNSYLHFKQVAEITQVPIEVLRALNPQYRMDIIPAKADKPYVLKIPIETVADFIDNEEEIYAFKRDEFFPNNSIINPQSRSTYYPTDIKGKDKVIYTVKSGDNLGFISEWYHVGVSDLRYWNNIHRNLIRVGQKLSIYVPAGQADFYADVNRMSFSDKQAFKKKTPVTKAGSTSQQVTKSGEFVYYTVRRGENLWSIARKFPGVSNNDIIRWNDINNGKKIFPGQKLKIKPRS